MHGHTEHKINMSLCMLWRRVRAVNLLLRSFLNSAIKRWMATFTSISLYLPCPLHRRLGAPQFWSGHFEEKEILCHACKLKPELSSPQRSHSTLLSDASLIYIAQIHILTPPYNQYRMCKSVVSQNWRDMLDIIIKYVSVLWWRF
jgi:hypothetical protein